MTLQITMAEDFALEGCIVFYDQTGAILDVIQNHLFQVVSDLAIEPPVRTDGKSIRDRKITWTSMDATVVALTHTKVSINTIV